MNRYLRESGHREITKREPYEGPRGGLRIRLTLDCGHTVERRRFGDIDPGPHIAECGACKEDSDES